MKKKDLERYLKELGFYFKREGGNHEVWTNGKISIPIPRHNEVKEPTAKSILKQAKNEK
jgi:mRNA interferase HicA